MKRDPAASGEPAPKPRGAFAVACRYLTSRERCAAQVSKFLERHAYGAEEIEEAVRLLREKRFIDDLRYARQYVDVRSRRSPRSGVWLVRELIARGIDRETAQRAVDDLLKETPEEDLARRLLSRMGGRGRPDLAQRAAQRLRSRGFSASIAFAWAKEQDRAGEAAAGVSADEGIADEDAHFLNEDNEE